MTAGTTAIQFNTASDEPATTGKTMSGIICRSFGMARCFKMFLARPLP